MTSNSIKALCLVAATVILLVVFAIASFNNHGEVLSTGNGTVEKCTTLDGGNGKTISHATIKDEKGSYLIASVTGCEIGAEVTIFIKRGALYFNTIFDAEPIQHPKPII